VVKAPAGREAPLVQAVKAPAAREARLVQAVKGLVATPAGTAAVGMGTEAATVTATAKTTC
jgi:hypothetical protein